MCMVNGRNMMISLVELLKHCYTLHTMFEQKNIHLQRNTLQSLVYFPSFPPPLLPVLLGKHPWCFIPGKFTTQDGHHIDDLRVLCHWCHITFALGAKFLHLCCCGRLSTSTLELVIFFINSPVFFWELYKGLAGSEWSHILKHVYIYIYCVYSVFVWYIVIIYMI